MKMTPIDPKELEILVAKMRALGVQHFSHDGLVITLSPDWRPESSPEAPPTAEVIAEKPRLGKDGLTEADQMELYGRLMG